MHTNGRNRQIRKVQEALKVILQYFSVLGSEFFRTKQINLKFEQYVRKYTRNKSFTLPLCAVTLDNTNSRGGKISPKITSVIDKGIDFKQKKNVLWLFFMVSYLQFCNWNFRFFNKKMHVLEITQQPYVLTKTHKNHILNFTLSNMKINEYRCNQLPINVRPYTTCETNRNSS